jgi:TIR domain-containing protein
MEFSYLYLFPIPAMFPRSALLLHAPLGALSVMSSIFISYRRVGALVHARALFERLRHEFGPNEVFIDLEGVDYGLDFVDILNEQLNGCQVMLAVIDPQWATATDRHGRRRIERENDYVRTEIVTALSRGIRTVPVLVDGAEMPDASDLPEPLRPLTRRNALVLDFSRFDAEVSRLIGVIRKILAAPAPFIAQQSAAVGPESLAVAPPPGSKANEGSAQELDAVSPSQQQDRTLKQGRQRVLDTGEPRNYARSSNQGAADMGDEAHLPNSTHESRPAPAGESIVTARTHPRRYWLIMAIALALITALIVVWSQVRPYMHSTDASNPTKVTTAQSARKDLVESLESNLIVGQYFGTPLVLATLRVENPDASTVNITDIRGTLAGPQSTIIVAPVSWTVANSFGPFAPVTGPFPIFAGAKLDLRLVMITGANYGALYGSLSELAEYKAQMPCIYNNNGVTKPMTAAGFQVAKDFAEGHFVWLPGEWTLRIDTIADNSQNKGFTRQFTLSPVDVAGLRNSINLLKECLSSNATTPLAQDGSLANFLSK